MKSFWKMEFREPENVQEKAQLFNVIGIITLMNVVRADGRWNIYNHDYFL